MAAARKKRTRNSIIRALFVAISLLLQVGWILLSIRKLNDYSVYISLATGILAAAAVLRLASRETTSAYKIPWIILIMALPVMGLSLYLMTEVAITPKRMHSRIQGVRQQTGPYLQQDARVLAALEQEDADAAGQSRYLLRCDGSPVYANTAAEYFGDCAEAFERMKEDLEKAERFIFMEYFIVEDGESFRQLKDILVRKASQGVEVRLMYDDIGSIGKANWQFAAELNRAGIRCSVFNPAIPVLSLFMNNRDHRKITVIDGKVGYTGGYNLADEYFGITAPYGHWKDTGLRLEGEAVRSLAAAFLEMWAVAGQEDGDVAQYLRFTHSVAAKGFVQPYGESPLDKEQTAENVYLNLINQAKHSLWIMTPYLIITEEMSRALALAAKRGVDVRIITPGVPDKRTVYAVTRSYYPALVKNGVRIFEYTPGFCHGKICVADGKIASIGTSNLDYRSLYLHFENNVLLSGCDAVEQITGDFRACFTQCREVTESYRSTPLRIWQCILRLFAPLM